VNLIVALCCIRVSSTVTRLTACVIAGCVGHDVSLGVRRARALCVSHMFHSSSSNANAPDPVVRDHHCRGHRAR
jgi:hypothetical protein